MYAAELRGKVPSKLKRSEDILTSNVFSFLKYADRRLFLRSLITQLGVDATDSELDSAEFLFWPSYDDRTEPDLVVIIGDHYLLFEAKYMSRFVREKGSRKNQLEREIEAGLREATRLDKRFVLIIVTADPHSAQTPLRNIPGELPKHVRWINWQSISRILLVLLEKHGKSLVDYDFASDLYTLLVEKGLRGFMSFDRLAGIYSGRYRRTLFFNAESATFRGRFIGFDKALSGERSVRRYPAKLFFERRCFQDLPSTCSHSTGTLLFEEDV